MKQDSTYELLANIAYDPRYDHNITPILLLFFNIIFKIISLDAAIDES